MTNQLEQKIKKELNAGIYGDGIIHSIDNLKILERIKARSLEIICCEVQKAKRKAIAVGVAAAIAFSSAALLCSTAYYKNERNNPSEKIIYVGDSSVLLKDIPGNNYMFMCVKKGHAALFHKNITGSFDAGFYKIAGVSDPAFPGELSVAEDEDKKQIDNFLGQWNKYAKSYSNAE